MQRSEHFRPLVAIVFALFFTMTLATGSHAQLSAESYCEVVVEIGREGVEYLGQVDALTQKYCDDPNFFAAYCVEPNLFLLEKAALEAESDEMVSAVLSSHGTTATECVAFLNENREAIEQYRDSDPNVKEAFDSLSSQINKLSEKLKVPSYCLLAIANVRQQSADLAELIALAKGHSGDPNSFLQQEQAKRKELDAGKTALLESFDMSSHEYLTFMSKNKQAVEAFFKAHVHIKDAVDAFSAELHSLLEEYETLRSSIVKQSEAELPG